MNDKYWPYSSDSWENTTSPHTPGDQVLFSFVLRNISFVSFCSVSPPGGDFSDPVTSATLGIVQVSHISTTHLFYNCF